MFETSLTLKIFFGIIKFDWIDYRVGLPNIIEVTDIHTYVVWSGAGRSKVCTNFTVEMFVDEAVGWAHDVCKDLRWWNRT